MHKERVTERRTTAAGRVTRHDPRHSSPVGHGFPPKSVGEPNGLSLGGHKVRTWLTEECQKGHAWNFWMNVCNYRNVLFSYLCLLCVFSLTLKPLAYKLENQKPSPVLGLMLNMDKLVRAALRSGSKPQSYFLLFFFEPLVSTKNQTEKLVEMLWRGCGRRFVPSGSPTPCPLETQPVWWRIHLDICLKKHFKARWRHSFRPESQKYLEFMSQVSSKKNAQVELQANLNSSIVVVVFLFYS